MAYTESTKRVAALERQAQVSRIVDNEAFEQAKEIIDDRLLESAVNAERQIATHQNVITGFVRVEEASDSRNEFSFSGILLPFEYDQVDKRSNTTYRRLRNRLLVVGKHAHEWFVPFCREVLADGQNMRLRVRIYPYGDNLAFMLAAARTPEHAKTEWTVAQAIHKSILPARLHQYSPTQLARTVYDRFARVCGGSITHYCDATMQAIAVDRAGNICVLSNGDKIEEYCGSLTRHDVIMDRELLACVQWRQLTSLEQLNTYLNAKGTQSAELQFRS